MTIYTLYKKTHNQTGLKYLGQTTRDPFLYKGSGTRWNHHIKKHGNDVTTEILGQFSSNEELGKVGLELSTRWNIVESNEWANIKPETGQGGCEKGVHTHPPERRKRMSESHLGLKHSDSHKAAIAAANSKPMAKRQKEAISKALKGNIPWNKGLKLDGRRKPLKNPLKEIFM